MLSLAEAPTYDLSKLKFSPGDGFYEGNLAIRKEWLGFCPVEWARNVISKPWDTKHFPWLSNNQVHFSNLVLFNPSVAAQGMWNEGNIKLFLSCFWSFPLTDIIKNITGEKPRQEGLHFVLSDFLLWLMTVFSSALCDELADVATAGIISCNMENPKPRHLGSFPKANWNCLPWAFFLNDSLLYKTSMTKLNCKCVHHKRLGNTSFICFPFQHYSGVGKVLRCYQQQYLLWVFHRPWVPDLSIEK